LYAAIPTARGNIPAFGGPGQCIHSIAMPFVGIEYSSSSCVLDLHSMIPTARGNIPAFGGPGKGAHFIGVSHVVEEKLARQGFPDSYRFVSTSSSNEASIRRPGQRLNDTPCIFDVGVECFSGQCVPDQYCVVPISRGNELAAG
jgi:hypothetical protein